MVIAIFSTHKTKRSQQEYHFFICQKNPSHCFSGKADAIPFHNITLTSPKHHLSFKSMASTFPQKQSETSQSANKKMIHLLRAAAYALGQYFHCFCKSNKLLFNFISKLHNSDKAIYYTHKIKP